MSDLLKYAELEQQRIRAEAAASQFEAEQKHAADLRSKAISALRQFLPKDRVWEIETGGPVQIQSYQGGGHWLRGLELTVDGLTFGYAETTWGYPSERRDQLFLRICKDCGGPIWTHVNQIVDLARQGECPKCHEKPQADAHDSSSLAAHLKSVEEWHSHNVSGYGYQPEARHQTCLMIAYDRWLNGRPLLKDER